MRRPYPYITKNSGELVLLTQETCVLYFITETPENWEFLLPLTTVVSYSWSFSSFTESALAPLCICFSIQDKGLKLLEDFFFFFPLSCPILPWEQSTDQSVVSEGQRKTRHTRKIKDIPCSLKSVIQLLTCQIISYVI